MISPLYLLFTSDSKTEAYTQHMLFFTMKGRREGRPGSPSRQYSVCGGVFFKKTEGRERVPVGKYPWFPSEEERVEIFIAFVSQGVRGRGRILA